MEVESWQKRLLNYSFDWGIALFLTILGFWLFSAWRTPDLPDSAPDWELSSIDGGTVSLSDFKGKTVVLNFWATWCQPCVMEIPNFEKFSKENPDIPVLGIAMDGKPQQLKAFAQQHNMTYPIVIANTQVQNDYKVTTLPMTVIVGPDGKVKDTHIGIMMEQQLKWATN
jgi:peroxiredoxin